MVPNSVNLTPNTRMSYELYDLQRWYIQPYSKFGKSYPTHAHVLEIVCLSGIIGIV